MRNKSTSMARPCCTQSVTFSSSMAVTAIPSHTSLLFLLHLYLLLSPAAAITFHKPNFDPNDASILCSGGASASSGTVKLTNAHYGIEVSRVTYAEGIPIWSSATGKLSDFATRFTFSVDAESGYPSGIAFFLAPPGFQAPENSAGGYMGLYNYTDRVHPRARKQVVHVEFDYFVNPAWDPPFRHVGINNNSLASEVVAPWNPGLRPGGSVLVDVNYTASTHNLTVFWEYENGRNSSLWYVIDLREVLPEWVMIGFSATSNDYSGEQELLSWDFYSDLEILNPDRGRNFRKRKVIGLVAILVAIAVAVKLGAFGFLQMRRKRGGINKGMNLLSMTDEFSRGTGPRKFSYTDLVSATKNFSLDRKLGEGGFGAVYRGCLRDSGMPVAVKKISRGSRQGIKEYKTEVTIISRLRHRNLVQLIGWCHEKGQLLLVYQFMPKGSLDSHLFGENTSLRWPERYSIAIGLASALLYLHEEWEQCVVHRDIKAANVMLDSGFTVKLGDFGLARLVDHELGPQTTRLAGTIGYMAPEYISTGRASKESDVYSFGVVCLEIATGRRVVDYIEDGLEMCLVEWVWELHGNGNHSVAIDKRLVDFDEREVECLMVVGLWCAHPDSCQRASIRQAIQVLNFELPFPRLPEKRPFPVFHVQAPASSESCDDDEPLLSYSSIECDSI